MLWGLAIHDQYWEEFNLKILNSAEKFVLDSEQDIARKIGMRLLSIKSELPELKNNIELDVPSIVLEGIIPELISGSKIEDDLKFCIENTEKLSNKNT